MFPQKLHSRRGKRLAATGNGVAQEGNNCRASSVACSRVTLANKVKTIEMNLIGVGAGEVALAKLLATRSWQALVN